MRIGPKSTKTKKDAIGKLRKTQLITTFAPGAIADMPDYSVILAATDYWSNKSHTIHEPNLERLLGIKGFKEPYVTDSENPKGNPDVPAFRFPRMHFCPKCGDLKDYKLFGDSKHKKCQCGRQLVPSRFVCSCINGHLEDFPYKWWVHYGNYSECPAGDKWDQISIEFKNTTGGLSSIVIKCKACGKTRTMEGCMSKDALKGYKCKGKRPWIGFDKQFDDVENCMAPMKTLQRGASNVYFSVTQSALTIPPYSQKIQSDLSDKWEEVKGLFDNKMDDENIKIVLGASIFRQTILEGRYSADDYFKAAKERYQMENPTEEVEIEDNYTEKNLYLDEYEALCAGHEQDEDDVEPEQFIAVESELPDILDGFVESVMLVKRLREVLAVKGFRRITPEKPHPDDNRSVGMDGREYQPVWNKPHDWMPAIQMRGEGLFLKFDEEKLREWEDRNSARYDLMKERLGDYNIGKGMMSPRYVVLHTFAHLLIRQLTLECGYSGAALKERIYSTFPDSDKPMAGVLIYTSSSDSDGSLGGLVRQGEPELLETTIRNMLQEASWCSSDPLCSDSTAQGFNSLNYAACHACTLLPETSCEARNCLLDRVSIVGTYDDRSLGFFGELLEEEE